MREEEIKESQKALEHAISKKESTNILDIVNRLKRGVIATESLLRSTKLGIVVGKLRTHEDKNVADLAKETVRKWKNDVAGHKKPDTPSSSISTTTTNASTIPSTGKAVSPVVPTKLSTENVPVVTNGDGNVKTENGPTTTVKKTRDAKTDGIKNPTGEKVRDGSIILLYNAIVLDSTESSSHILSVTKSLELQIFRQTSSDREKTPNTAYRTKIRSLFQNLKSNPSLRQNLVAGALSVERLTTMTSAEMASDERRQEDQKLQEMNIFNAQGAAPKMATTNEFMCGKCKQRKVSYYQMQTRSADEPMTTFCRCEVCGNRWKF